MDFLAFIQRIFPDLKQWLSRLPDKRERHELCFPQSEALRLGIFMFAFKFPSLRDFFLSSRTNEFLINLGSYFKIQGVPSDDGLRYILSRLEAGQINWVLKNMNEALRTRKILKDQYILDEYELVVMDGSGYITNSCWS